MKIQKNYFILLISFLFNQLYSKQIDSRTAEIVAINFLKTKTILTSLNETINLNLVNINSSKESKVNSFGKITNYFFIFNINDSGYIAVSADDIVYPILAYSMESKFDPSKTNSTTQKWFQGYSDQIRFAIINDLKATESIKEQWQDLLSCNIQIAKRQGSISPLLKTKWNQGTFYNSKCPYDYSNNERTVTGCVATAMAQVLNYWQFPGSGVSYHSYNHENLGTISSNFANHTYNFSNMPNYVYSENNDVAQLMFDCGVSVEMDYDISANGGSGAYVISKASRSTHCTEYALKTYFGYTSNLYGYRRSEFSDSQWTAKLKNDLDKGQPIIYAGFGNGGGHCFIADGYDNNNYFHFNWGWGGNSDGYFILTALNPGSLGSGGGTGGFNNNQQAIFGIKPPDTYTNFDISHNTIMSITPSTIKYGQSFEVSANFTNNSNFTFSGDFGAAVFDEDDNFIDFIEIKTGYSLKSGYKYTNDLIFSTTGILKMLPGKYWIGIFFRPTGGNWSMVKSTFWYSNYKPITVTNSNDIALYSDINLEGAVYFTQGQPCSVRVNIVNNGPSEFKGRYAVSLFNLDGTLAQNINVYDETDGLPSGYIYNNPLSFKLSELTVSPGTYLLAVQHIFNGSNNWQLTGTGKFSNPILIDVQAPPLKEDIYEINDNASQAYNLSLTFSGKSSLIKTTGSNCHNGMDYDFYKVNLPYGYNYLLNPRIHDEYNSGNNISYTIDALFSYSLDGGSSWSDAYDDILPNSISASGGKTILFKVAPYFTGNTGTYLLEIPVIRESNLKSIISKNNEIVIYPNPTNDFINIDAGNFTITRITISDFHGREVAQFEYNLNNIKLSIKELKNGPYFISILTNNGTITRKLIKE